jgi:hypothetical protein
MANLIDRDELDRLIDQLDSMVPGSPSWIIASSTNWKQVWNLSAEIHDGFKRVSNPTRNWRESAWGRFVRIRQRASEASREDIKIREFRSAQHRDRILGLVGLSQHKPILDMVFFWDQTTVEDMKRWGRQLSQAGQMLSEAKHEMMGEHKRECFEAIAEARKANEAWWASYKQHSTRHRAEKANLAAERQRQFHAKRDELRANARRNIDENRRRLAKAADALSRCRSRCDDLRIKVATAWSDGFRNRAEAWLAEELDRQADIERSISRIQEWIEEGERRLADLS